MISYLHPLNKCCWGTIPLYILMVVNLFFWFPERSFAQDKSYTQFNKENGLAGNVAYCITQDKDGFIWIGTENGASRYDGTNFKTFTVEDGLTDNEVLEVFADSKGRIWFSCYTGRICYYYKGIIYNEDNDPVLKKASVINNLTKIVEDKDGNIWFRSEHVGVYTTDGKFKYFHTGIVKEPMLRFASVAVFIPNPEMGGIDIAINNTLYNYRIDRISKIGRFIVDITDYPELAKIPLNLISSGQKNRSIVYGRNFYSLLVWKEANNPELRSIKLGIGVNKLIKDANTNEYWVTVVNKGAFRVNDLLQSTTETFFPDKNITDAITDKEGNKWFTSLEEGVLMIDNNSSQIYDAKSGIEEMNIVSINNVNGAITAGSYAGNLYQLKGKRFERIFINGRPQIKTGPLRNVKSNNNGILLQYNSEIQTYQLNRFQELKAKYFGAIKATGFQSDTSIYLASHIGLFLATESGIDTIIYRERFTALSNTINNITWAASTKNLYQVKGLSLIKNNVFDVQKDGRIADMIQTKDGTLWISTYSYGLLLIRNTKLVKIDKSRGLASNQCRAIYKGDGDEIWVVTNIGVSNIHYSKSESDSFNIVNYDQSDGLPNCNINRLTICNDTLWLATNKGVISFLPYRNKAAHRSSIQITEIRQDNIPLLLTEKNLRIKSNGLQITYASIMFNSNRNTIFNYILEGLDVNWNTTTQRQIEYASLSPGDYIFKVYSIDKNGNKSTNTAELYFTVLPQWWQTLWFKVGVASILLYIFWYIYKKRINKVKTIEREKLQTLRRMSELKLETLRSQLNPHFIFNSLNAIQNYLLEHDARSASGYLNDFSKVIRKSLQLSLNNFIPLQEEAELLHSFLKLEKMRFDNGFDYEIKIDDGLNNFYVPTLVFQHYAENAVKHGIRGLHYRGQITIVFTTSNDQLLCIIEDNGRGIDKVKVHPTEGTGLGLQLHDSRTKLLNITYDLNISIKYTSRSETDSALTGIRVEIKMPILTSREIELKHLNEAKEDI